MSGIRVGASQEVAERLGLSKGETLAIINLHENGNISAAWAASDGRVAGRDFSSADKEQQWGSWREFPIQQNGQVVGKIGFDIGKTGEFGIYDVNDNLIQWTVPGDGAGHYRAGESESHEWVSMRQAGHRENRKGFGNSLSEMAGHFIKHSSLDSFYEEGNAVATKPESDLPQEVKEAAKAVVSGVPSVVEGGMSVDIQKLEGRIIRQGSRGADVQEMQEALQLLGYSSVGPADGINGRNTTGALRAFQKDHGLAVDGVFGPNTFAKMSEQLVQRQSEVAEAAEVDAPNTPKLSGDLGAQHGVLR